MSRLKRIAISMALTLTVLGGTTMLWYQSHYRVALPEPVPDELPSPNGYDTLKKAVKQRTTLRSRLLESGSLGPSREHCRKLLAGNQKMLATMRLGLQQDCRVPLGEAQEFETTPLAIDFAELGAFLDLAVGMYTEQGNLPEAMRCATDSIALGIKLPCGGGWFPRQFGNSCEEMGQRNAWELADKVDARTALQAVRRLEQLEGQCRWPAAENVRVELYDTLGKLSHLRYARGPVGTSKNLDSWLEREGRDLPQELWTRARIVYEGPKAYVDYADATVKGLKELSDNPWQPQRPRIPALPSPLYNGNDSDGIGFAAVELEERTHKVFAALLRTYLALRAYRLEQGSYPDSLESLMERDYLAAVPTDLFSTTLAPLRYRRNTDGTMTLWSVGPDAADDDGKSIDALQDRWVNQKEGYLSGDIVANCTDYPNLGINDYEPLDEFRNIYYPPRKF